MYKYGILNVLVYVTGHGYQNDLGQQYILLNDKISFSQNNIDLNYGNPFPIE